MDAKYEDDFKKAHKGKTLVYCPEIDLYVVQDGDAHDDRTSPTTP